MRRRSRPSPPVMHFTRRQTTPEPQRLALTGDPPLPPLHPGREAPLAAASLFGLLVGQGAGTESGGGRGAFMEPGGAGGSPPPSVVEDFGENASSCGYCRRPGATSISHGARPRAFRTAIPPSPAAPHAPCLWSLHPRRLAPSSTSLHTPASFALLPHPVPRRGLARGRHGPDTSPLTRTCVGAGSPGVCGENRNVGDGTQRVRLPGLPRQRLEALGALALQGTGTGCRTIPRPTTASVGVSRFRPRSLTISALSPPSSIPFPPCPMPRHSGGHMSACVRILWSSPG